MQRLLEIIDQWVELYRLEPGLVSVASSAFVLLQNGTNNNASTVAETVCVCSDYSGTESNPCPSFAKERGAEGGCTQPTSARGALQVSPSPPNFTPTSG